MSHRQKGRHIIYLVKGNEKQIKSSSERWLLRGEVKRITCALLLHSDQISHFLLNIKCHSNINWNFSILFLRLLWTQLEQYNVLTLLVLQSCLYFVTEFIIIIKILFTIELHQDYMIYMQPLQFKIVKISGFFQLPLIIK